MMKFGPEDKEYSSTKSMLQSRIFFSTLEFAGIPELAIDLLPYLIDRIEYIWEDNISIFKERLTSMVRLPYLF